MAIRFRVVPYNNRPDTEVVEILLDGQVVAKICPDGGNEIKLVSAHVAEVHHDYGTGLIPPVSAIVVALEPSPHTNGVRKERK